MNLREPVRARKCGLVAFQLKTTAIGTRGYFKVTYKVFDDMTCTAMGIMCTHSIAIWYVLPEKQYNITLENNGVVTINGDVYTDAAYSMYRPFNDDYVYVKKVTSLLYMVAGNGFKILYDPNGRIYIILDPYYKEKVRCLTFPGNL